jgi:prepilin-type N-terminal cleavage/methylation domain-containing protein
MEFTGTHPMLKNRPSGFTLAELLIALAILGVIATFTIPKILTNQRVGTYNASAHEAAATIAGAYQQHSARGLLTTNTYGSDLTQYLNYVKVSTAGTIDDRPGGTGTLTCSVTEPCLTLHNGAILQPENNYFGGTATTNYVGWVFDPDGVYTGNADSQKFYIYYNGKMVDRNNVMDNSRTNGGGASISSCTNCNASWFSW